MAWGRLMAWGVAFWVSGAVSTLKVERKRSRTESKKGRI